MHHPIITSALLMTVLCSCESVRTVYDANGKVVQDHEGARERSLNDYFDEEFDSGFSEKQNAHGVPEATSKKVSSYQKDIDAARREDKEYSTGTYNPGGSNNYNNKRFADANQKFDSGKRFEGFSGDSQFNTDMRPAFMSENKGISRTAYTGHSSGDRYSDENSNYDAHSHIYATHNNNISTSDTSSYIESRREKWGKPTIINKGEYYKRTIEETRGLLGRDN